jgi:hypothetical protein
LWFSFLASTPFKARKLLVVESVVGGGTKENGKFTGLPPKRRHDQLLASWHQSQICNGYGICYFRFWRQAIDSSSLKMRCLMIDPIEIQADDAHQR